MTVYAVHAVWDESIGHGFEVLALFSTAEKAERHAQRCRAHQDEFNANAAKLGSTQFHHGFEVEPWIVDEEDRG